MRFRLLAFLTLLFTVWGISQLAAQDMTPQEEFAIRAANVARPELGQPSARRFEALPKTRSSNLGCELAAGVATDLGQDVFPFKVELTYPDGVYVVHVTAGGTFTQLCDEKFGDKVTAPQPSFSGNLRDNGNNGRTTVCQMVGSEQPTLRLAPFEDAPIVGGDVLVEGRAFPIGDTYEHDWYQVLNTANQMGWVSASGITLENCEDLITTAVIRQPEFSRSLCYITPANGTANVRSKFETDAPIQLEISQGQYWQVYAKTESGRWYFINPGWVAASAVSEYGDCSQLAVNMDLYPGMPTSRPTSTVDPNFVPSPTTVPTVTPTQFLGTPLAQDYVCPAGFEGYRRPRIKPGFETASVAAGRVNNRLRTEPNTSGTVVAEAEPGAIFDKVITGPACFEGYVWWLVEINGAQGWTVESSADDYFLDALAGIPATALPTATLDPNIPTITPTLFLGTPLAESYICPPDFAGYAPPRLTVGAETARVTDGGASNRLRSAPNSGGTILATAEPGLTLERVLAGPACGDDDVWWLVESHGVRGWTAESRGTTYYLEPLAEFIPTAAPSATPTIDPNLPTATPTLTPTMFLGTPLAQSFVCPPDFAGFVTPRITEGVQTARVREGGTGNRLRAEPSVESEQIGFVDQGVVFDRVLTGPACSGTYVWWLVESDGAVGWTVESDSTDGDYALEPVSEPEAEESGLDQIAFTSDRDGDLDIYTMLEDGSDVRLLTGNDETDLDPIWSPDGSQIAFFSDPDNDTNYDLYVMDANGTNLRPLVVNGAYNITASWSPDGTQIVFASIDDDSNRSIYVLQVDSGEVNMIRDNGSAPDWSPDGTQIAFIRDKDLYVMRADGEQVRRLTDYEPQNYYPDWSPDGTQILFSSFDPESGPPENLYNVNVITLETNEVTLIKAGLDSNNVGWSRDGTEILFDSNRDGNTEIYVMSIESGEERRLTNDEASDYYADWSPASPDDE